MKNEIILGIVFNAAALMAYQVTIDNPHGVSRGIVRAVVDGAEVPHAPCEIAMVDDGRTHAAGITLG